MKPRQTIQPGTILRADFFWKDEPKADGKARNCVVIATAGRRAIICPITSLSKENAAHCRRIDDRVKRGISRMKDEKDSWINLAEQNIVYLDGPRLYRDHASRGDDPRIHGQLPANMSVQIAKEAIALKVKPSKKQVETDWKEDILHLKGREAVATIKAGAGISTSSREERVKLAAAQRLNRDRAERDKAREEPRPKHVKTSPEAPER